MLEIALRILLTNPFDKSGNFLVSPELLKGAVHFRKCPLIEDRVNFAMANSVDFKFISPAVHLWNEMMLVERGSLNHFTTAKWAGPDRFSFRLHTASLCHNLDLSKQM